MPRRPRIKLAGMPQHIVQRGINREPCFFADEDYFSYLHWLQKAAVDWHCAIHAYVLMTNHWGNEFLEYDADATGEGPDEYRANEAPQAEVIYGGSGNDLISAGSGDDVVSGGPETLGQNETDDTYRWLTQRTPRQHSLMKRAA